MRPDPPGHAFDDDAEKPPSSVISIFCALSPDALTVATANRLPRRCILDRPPDFGTLALRCRAEPQ